MKILLLLLFLCLSPVISTSEAPDETLILRLRPSLKEADKELHVRTNSLGKLLVNDTGAIASPLVASPQLPSLSCVNTSQDCSWKTNQAWKKINVTVTGKISIPIPTAMTSCHYNNGGCEWNCRVLRNDISECYCPDGFSLNSDSITCSPANTYGTKLTESTMKDEFGLNYYSSNVIRRWLIVVPRGNSIHLHISWINTEKGYDMVRVFGGPRKDKLFEGSGSWGSFPVHSSSRAVLVVFSSDSSNDGRGFMAKGELGSHQEPVVTALELNDREGYLSIPIVLPRMLCVSAVYTGTSDESLSLYVGSHLGSSTNLPKSYHLQVDNWHIQRFKKTCMLNEIGLLQNLTVKFTGQGKYLISISLCDATVDEDVYYLGASLITQDTKYASEYLKKLPEYKNCYNGGTFSTSYNACICPSGFTGKYCEEGCGPNRFGNDCGGLCSAFGEDCKKLLFCKNNLPCLCAPGLQGEFCEDPCNEGEDSVNISSEHYGANCSIKCGECLHGNCDPVSGRCGEGCRYGYYPPLCQETYARITNAPQIIQKRWNYAQISVDFSTFNGRGAPKFYQILLQELPSDEWMGIETKLVTKGKVTTGIEDLKAGTKYKIKVIIISEDGQSYQGGLIPLREFETACSVPDSNEYQIGASDITATGFKVSWKYEISSPSWCPITTFEIILLYGQQNISYILNIQETTKLFSNLVPGTTYYVSVQAITEHGRVPKSVISTITTLGKAPGLVRLLNVRPSARLLQVTWETPRSTGGNITSYKVVYQCIKFLACSLSCENSKGEKDVYGMSADIDNLIPHAQYLIGVAGKSVTLGPYSYVHSTTNQTVPSVAPEPSKQPIVSASNTSITVQWMPPNCSGLNGYSEGYYYELIEAHPTERKLLQHNTSLEIQTSFHGLKPYTNFEVNIYAINMIGRNTINKLSIPAATAASVPEAVHNLNVYKKGRRLIGIRWAPPLRSSGTLKAFSVSYKKSGSQTEIREIVGLEPCPAWPNLYCHTIAKLVPDTEYVISVRAQNVETENEGQALDIRAVTREGVPGVPNDLQLHKITNESLQITWGLPYIINGVLRSFLINVEHTDSLDVTDCCEYFPVQELPVHEEAPLYTIEVSGLRPAATYTVSVSAKTLTMGPAVNMTCNTSPTPPTIINRPETFSKEDGTCKVRLKPSEIPLGVNGTYLLMILPHEEYTEPEIFDEGLAQLLREAVKEPFYIVAEYNASEMTAEKVLNLGTESSAINGKMAVVQDPKLPQQYTVGLALVLDYSGSKSVGFVKDLHEDDIA